MPNIFYVEYGRHRLPVVPSPGTIPSWHSFKIVVGLVVGGIQNERTKTWSKFIITTHANIYRYRCRKELTGIRSLGPWGTLSIWSVPFVRASNSMCVLRVYLSVLTAEEICLVPYPRIGGSSFVWNWCCLLSLLKGHIGRQITHNHCINNWDSFGRIFGWLGGSSIHIRSICWLFAVIQWFLNFIKIFYGQMFNSSKERV